MRLSVSRLVLLGSLSVMMLRSFQFLFLYNTETGFFEDSGLSSIVALVLTFIITITIDVLTNKRRCYRIVYSIYENTKTLSVTAVVLLMTLVSLVWMVWDYRNDILSLSYNGEEALLVPLIIATGLMVVFFIANCVQSYSGNDILGKYKFFYLIPIAWSLILIIYFFVHNSVHYMVTENIFAMCSVSAMTFSLLNVAKFTVGINVKKNSFISCITWVSLSSILGIGYAGSEIIISVFGKHIDTTPSVYIMILILSVNTYLISQMTSVEFKVLEPENYQRTGGTRFK